MSSIGTENISISIYIKKRIKIPEHQAHLQYKLQKNRIPKTEHRALQYRAGNEKRRRRICEKPRYVQGRLAYLKLISALAVNLTIAQLLIWAVDGVHAENHMPQELHHPSRRGVAQFRVDNPLAEFDVILTGPELHLRATKRELRTARGANLVRFAQVALVVGLCLVRRRSVEGWSGGAVEDVPPDLIGDVGVVAVGFLAAGVPVAAEVDVAVLLDEIELEHAHCGDVVVERSVDMPGH